MNRRSQRQMQLLDSNTHGNECELFIVEGESAASSVSALCDKQLQAVLPLQGKPLNAYKASRDKVQASPLHIQFANALGLACPTKITTTELKNLNYGKILLLFDPDADGIHIGALVLLYIQRWLPELIEHNKVFMLRSPMYSVTSKNKDNVQTTQFAYLPQQLSQLKNHVKQADDTLVKTERFQSVGSVPPDVLAKLCIDPTTRQANLVNDAHIQAIISIFG